MIEQLICWFFGHKSDGATLGFVFVSDIEFTASICRRCKSTIVWDEDRIGWVKW